MAVPSAEQLADQSAVLTVDPTAALSADSLVYSLVVPWADQMAYCLAVLTAVLMVDLSAVTSADR